MCESFCSGLIPNWNEPLEQFKEVLPINQQIKKDEQNENNIDEAAKHGATGSQDGLKTSAQYLVGVRGEMSGQFLSNRLP